MKYYLFRLIDGESIEEAQKELEKQGLKDLYVIEDDAVGEVLLGGRSRKAIVVERVKKSLLAEEKTESAVDWEEQWSLFAENFQEGKARIDLSRFGVEKTLELTPGAGFGDLSHPTTYLMLEMMQGRVKGEKIVDIGTGSGILALAAILLGAASAIGIDIDSAAISHAKENGTLNGLEKQVKFSKALPKKMADGQVFLMNMIFPEQKKFDPKRFNPLAKLWIVSGVLAEQKEEYLAHAAKWGWDLVAEHKRAEWMGFVLLPK